MLGVTARKTVPIALAGVVFACMFGGGNSRREFGPNDPIAADGSMTAGRAATIYDTNPLLRENAAADRDDPADFEPLIKTERQFVEFDRLQVEELFGRVDWSLCQDPDRRDLMWAVRGYYRERGRLLAEFAVRGPRAKAAMEQEWSTPTDRQIDDYVRHLIQYGILHKSDFSARSDPEFNKVFADVEELGNGCAAGSR